MNALTNVIKTHLGEMAFALCQAQAQNLEMQQVLDNAQKEIKELKTYAPTDGETANDAAQEMLANR